VPPFEFTELLPILKKYGAGGVVIKREKDHPQTASFFRRGFFSVTPFDASIN